MISKTVILLVLCFFASVGVVVFLAAMSADLRRQPGSFLRDFPSFPAIEAEVLDLKYNSYYLAGGTGHHIYLANHSAPLHMVIANATLTDSQHVKLNLPGIYNEEIWSLSVKVDSPFFYVADGTVPLVYRGNVENWEGRRLVPDTTYFLDLLPLHGKSFFIKSLTDDASPQNVLGKITNGGAQAIMHHGILEKQVDGIFCTDGMMLYDELREVLLYLYRYRNEYIAMDTNLNVLYRGHTIDTTSRANITVAIGESDHEFSIATQISSPRRTVNKRSCVSNGNLFVHSLLPAKNESPRAHERASVIDVYDLEGGVYRFSFYVYDFQGKEKLRDFKVFGSRLYALFEQHLQVWDLAPEFFGGDALGDGPADR